MARQLQLFTLRDERAVEGDESEREYILELVRKAPKNAKKLRVGGSRRHGEEGVGDMDAQLEEMNHGESILARPRPHSELGGTGRRQVPYLFSAQNIPILRYKKPQPASLSGYINSRLQQRQKRHNLKQDLGDLLELARLEDRWDSIVYSNTGVNSRGDRGTIEPKWEYDARGALGAVQDALYREKEKNRVMAEKMLGVVAREASLAKEEAASRANGADKNVDPQKAFFEKRESLNDSIKLTNMVNDIVTVDEVKAEKTAGGSYQPFS